MNNIRRRLALITGASGGIGSACALQFAAAEVDLALTYSSNVASIEKLTEQLIELHPKIRISTHKLDLTNSTGISSTIKAIETEHGRSIDILVSNAGYGKRIAEVEDISIAEFDQMINVNLRAAFLLVQGVVGGMRANQWGRIVFVSSIAAYGAGLNGCHYAASKAGLQGMMKNLAAKLAKDNISINDVSPAMVGDTGMLANADAVPGIIDQIPLGRLCKPEEVANIVSMFCTTGFITGQSLIAAGGIR